MTGERTRPAHEGPAPVKALPGELDNGNGTATSDHDGTEAIPILLEPKELADLLDHLGFGNRIASRIAEQLGQLHPSVIASVVLPTEQTDLAEFVADGVRFILEEDDYPRADNFPITEHVTHILERQFEEHWRQWPEQTQDEVRSHISNLIAAHHDTAVAASLERVAATDTEWLRQVATRRGADFITAAIEETRGADG